MFSTKDMKLIAKVFSIFLNTGIRSQVICGALQSKLGYQVFAKEFGKVLGCTNYNLDQGMLIPEMIGQFLKVILLHFPTTKLWEYTAGCQ